MTQRPLSPHLQIYKPQLTSVLSITHRATGVVLSIGTLFIPFWLVCIMLGAETYETLHNIMSSWCGQISLFIFVFSLHYHLCNGVRHLFWDIGKGLRIEDTYMSGYAALVGAIILTILTFAL